MFLLIQPSVEYLSYIIDAERPHTTPENKEAAVNAPQPRNVQVFSCLHELLWKIYPKHVDSCSPLEQFPQAQYTMELEPGL